MEKNFYESRLVKEKDYKTSWNIYPKILKLAKLKKKDKILDAGCGEGVLIEFLNGFQIYGIELSGIAAKKAIKKGYKKIFVGKLKNNPFPNKSFDKTISIQVFQYLKDPEKDFKEILRVTKKEIIITVPNFNWLKLKSIFSKRYRKIYEKGLKRVNSTDKKFLENFAKQNNLNVKIRYISNRLGFLRNIMGTFLSSEIVGIYKRK